MSRPWNRELSWSLVVLLLLRHYWPRDRLQSTYVCAWNDAFVSRAARDAINQPSWTATCQWGCTWLTRLLCTCFDHRPSIKKPRQSYSRMHAAATVKPSSATSARLHSALRLMGMQPNILYCGETVCPSEQEAQLLLGVSDRTAP